MGQMQPARVLLPALLQKGAQQRLLARLRPPADHQRVSPVLPHPLPDEAQLLPQLDGLHVVVLGDE